MVDKLRVLISSRLRLFLDEHTGEVFKKSFLSTIVKVIAMFASLLLSIFLGRTLGADGLGVINLSNRIVTFLVTISLFGMQQVIIKEVAIAHRSSNLKRIANILHSSFLFNGAISGVLSIFFIVLTPILSTSIFNEERLVFPIIIFLAVMTFQVFSRIYSSALIGYKKIWQSNLVDQTLSVVITASILLILWVCNEEITILNVAICYAVGRLAVTISIRYYWKSFFVFNEKKSLVIKKFLRPSFSFFIITISSVIFANVDALILGAFSSTEDVGFYTVAARIALMTSFFLQVTNAALSPKIAALYSTGKLLEMERMVQKVTLALSILGVSTLFIFVVFGKGILSLWGEEFESAYLILIILGIGQFVNLSTGAVGLLLMMTKFEKLHGRIAFFFCVFNIIFSFLFIYFFDALGAAVATSLSIAGLNITTLIFVNKKLKISTIPFLKYF